jgi:hypothetical protein
MHNDRRRNEGACGMDERGCVEWRTPHANCQGRCILREEANLDFRESCAAVTREKEEENSLEQNY